MLTFGCTLFERSLDVGRRADFAIEKTPKSAPEKHQNGTCDMPKKTSELRAIPRVKNDDATKAGLAGHGDAPIAETVDDSRGNADLLTSTTVVQEAGQSESPVDPATPKTVDRGLAATLSTKVLKDRIWLRTLLMANRFRVVRTIDVAVLCFPERNFKAALTAAQRGMRGIVKAGLLKRYRSDRFQNIYGMTKRGADWLEEAGHEASSSVRRVSDMTNPEHRLWAQFWTLACEARGLTAMSEQELLRNLNKNVIFGQPLIQGYLAVSTMRGKVSRQTQLRPDAICREADGSTTWCEIDRSFRGADRISSLHALYSSVGRNLKDNTVLRNVVVFCKTERIKKRALNVLSELASANNTEVLAAGRRHFRAIDHDSYAVWMAVEKHLEDGRTQLVDTLVGYIIVQLLPIWLPKVRIDASNTHSMAGWFDENYLPYRRPPGEPRWMQADSPLLASMNINKN